MSLPAAASGFDRAPISRFLLFSTGVGSLALLFFRRSTATSMMALSSETFSKHQFYRLLSTHVFFGSAAELIIGSILLYNFRLFERHFGPRKFGGAIFFFILSTTLFLIPLLLLAPKLFPHASSGPYAIAFALLPSFIIDIPKISPFRVFGIPMSEKIFTYLLAIQLALAAPPASFFTALAAFFSGMIYRAEFLPFHKIRVPMFIMNFFTRLTNVYHAIFHPPPTTNPRIGYRLGGNGVGGAVPNNNNNGGAGLSPNNGDGGIGFESGGGSGRDGYARLADDDQSSQSSLMVDPSSVQQLVSMGFGENESRAALASSRNNVEAATNLLLSSR